MDFQYPVSIPICHDDYNAKHIGRTGDGKQFFLTTPFIPALGSEGCEFISLYLFDTEGTLLSYQIQNLGPRETLDETAAKDQYNALLNSLGDVEFGDIRIKPFQVENDGVTFGLIPIDPEFIEEDENGALEIQPGNYMAFYPPWDGDYDT